MATDNRFEELVANFTEYEEKMNKLWRVRNWLVRAINEACRDVNRAGCDDFLTVVPLGYGRHFEVFVCIDGQGETMIGLRNEGSLVTEGQITLNGVRQIFENPSPMLDAAAQFCAKLGRYEAFTYQMARFNMTRFNR